MRATKINLFLLRRGLTQAEIARRLGINKSNLSSLLSGRLVVPHHLDAIADALGISRRRLDALIEADSPRRRAA